MNKMATLLLGCTYAVNIFSQGDVTVQSFSTLSHLSIRAIEAVSDTKAWFAANHGVWGYTEDAGKTWHIDSIKVDTMYLEFRSMAVLNDSTVLLLSIASPAYLFKTTNKGKIWKLVYKNTNKNIFFDSMRFYDSKNGMAVADPIDGCIPILLTSDGGETWNRADGSGIPNAKEGEAFFATSNTNMDSYGNHLWLATGGVHARIFHSWDLGRHFETFNTPVAQGEKMTGIFSLDFINERTGIIAGGNYEKTDTSIVSLALTQDGGKTWEAIKNKKPFFGSCVQFRSADEFFVTGHDGTYFGNLKTGYISELKEHSDAPLKFHTLRLSPSGKSVWLAGSKGSITLISINK
jgi:photosystem II stability/assembly factor-like uncharacterized protein